MIPLFSSDAIPDAIDAHDVSLHIGTLNSSWFLIASILLLFEGWLHLNLPGRSRPKRAFKEDTCLYQSLEIFQRCNVNKAYW